MIESHRAEFVWFLLVFATFVCVLVGSAHDLAAAVSTSVIIAVTFIEVRMIGLHFMGIRSAPRAVRLFFEGCVVVAAMLSMTALVG
ncbi:cytochrome C oxidase subunit IV family protein [Nocardia sp. NPDC059246]|uniref:cytochrome C oxidase subunit IV family protein n=1 Tax=unclassified Nocardia TaxID=2637762 RepID=UPI003697B522